MDLARRQTSVPCRRALLALLLAAVEAAEPRDDGGLMRREARKMSKDRHETRVAMDIQPNGRITPHKSLHAEPVEPSAASRSSAGAVEDVDDEAGGPRAPELSFADFKANDVPSAGAADAVIANAGQHATPTAPPLPSQLPSGAPTVPVLASTAAPTPSNVTAELQAAKERLDDLSWILTLWKGLGLLLTVLLLTFAGLFAKESVAAKRDGHRSGYKDARARGRQEAGRSDGDGGLSGHEIRA